MGMKTTVDIPDNMLNKLIENTQAKTKKAAILAAIDAYNRRSASRAMMKHLGTFERFMTIDDLASDRDEQ